jgi:methyl-accepting chemotaxis protein
MHNAASVEQTTVAGQEIARIAEELNAMIDHFKVR